MESKDTGNKYSIIVIDTNIIIILTNIFFILIALLFTPVSGLNFY